MVAGLLRLLWCCPASESELRASELLSPNLSLSGLLGTVRKQLSAPGNGSRVHLELGAGSGLRRENPGEPAALVLEERGGDQGQRIKEAEDPEGKSLSAWSC